MPSRDTAPIGAPCWIDLLTSDVERSRAFYCDLFGWTAGASSAEFGGYFMFMREGVPVAGGMPSQLGMEPADAWAVYLASDDARKTVDAAWSNGGQVRMPPMEIADLGTNAVLTDPGGARIGVWQPATFHGLAVLGEPGTPAWFELLTRDYATAVRFYRDVFRWDVETTSDTPDFRYSTGKDDADPFAGIMDASGFLPDDAGATWSIYFGAGDTDAMSVRATELGGSIVKGAEDSPFGRLATIADPLGTQFRLITPPWLTASGADRR